MAVMASPTDTRLVPASDRAPSTWGLGDGQAIPWEYAAEDIKRLLRRLTTTTEARFDWLDDAASERPERIAAFLEMKTVWHPIGG
jgi:hypothetical protein